MINGECLIHPVYVVGEERGRYLIFGITHARRKGKGHANHKLAKNPKAVDDSTAYIRKKIEEDRKTAFTKERYSNYRMSPRDDEYVDALISKRKKK